MTDWEGVRRVLGESSDVGNPGPEEIVRIVQRPATIAVVGASRDPAKVARRVPAYLAARGWDVIPVNPNADSILGKRTHASLALVERPVDMVLLFRPSEQVGPFVRQAAARAERPVIWLQEGIRSDAEALEARTQGLTVVQDLCIYKVHRLLDAASADPPSEA